MILNVTMFALVGLVYLAVAAYVIGKMSVYGALKARHQFNERHSTTNEKETV